MLALWVVWGVLTAVVISLAVARKVAARNGDEYLHLVESEAAATAQQITVSHKLDWIDHWGKTLTVVDVLFGAALVVVMFYTAWNQSQQMIR